MAPLRSFFIPRGFREDCARLIERFRIMTSVRFEEFCEIWVDMKFSLVFRGTKSLLELYGFCEAALMIAKEFFLPPLCYKERIGGLYLLYGLYYKMPVSGPKIRSKPEDWPHILEFQEQIAQDKHHDASYILAKLMSDNAFIHCLFDKPFGLEKCYHRKEDRPLNPFSVLPEIRELAEPGDLFDRINTLSKYYALKKSETMGENCNEKNSSLSLYDSRLGEMILDSVKELEKSRKSKTNFAFDTDLEDGVEYCYGPNNFDRSKPSSSKSLGERDAIRAKIIVDYDSDDSSTPPSSPASVASNNDIPVYSSVNKNQESDLSDDSSFEK